MLISGHVTRSTLEQYNIVSLKNLKDAAAKLNTWKAKQPVGRVLSTAPSKSRTAKCPKPASPLSYFSANYSSIQTASHKAHLSWFDPHRSRLLPTKKTLPDYFGLGRKPENIAALCNKPCDKQKSPLFRSG